MRTIICLLVMFFCCKILTGQTAVDLSCLEDIVEHSKNVIFPKALGSTIVKGDTIEFDRSRIIFHGSSADGFLILKKKLLFPDLILGASTNGSGEFKMSSIDFIGTLSISSFEQIQNRASAAVRAYSFLLWQKNFANPKLYIVQLTNAKADEGTDASGFIDGAHVSAFGFCSILL